MPTTTPLPGQQKQPVRAPGGGRRALALVAMLLLLAVVTLASVAMGAKPLAVSDVWNALVAPAGSEADVIVRSMRLPRTLLAVVSGAALGLAGALAQGHTRNPLADPGLLGVSAGAAFAVVLAIYLLGVTSPLGYVWFAFAGALLASVGVFLVGSGGAAGATRVTLALSGAAVTALLTSLTSAVVLLDVDTLDAFRFWVVGSVAGRDVEVLSTLAPFLAVGAVLGVANGPALNTLSLGEDLARALGQNVAAARAVGLTATTLLTGAAVALCGPIGFVGLVVPHVARVVVGADHRWMLPCSGVAGAVLVTASDVVGRLAVRPGELQVGIVMALVGAPVFIALVRRRRLAAL